MIDFSSLESVRDWILSTNAERCKLAHEVVKFDRGVAFRRPQGIGLEPLMVRVGVCPSLVRARQLSCAHTSARNNLERAIVAMAEQGVMETDEVDRLRTALRRIADVIHYIDQEKNSEERRHALLSETQDMAGPALAANLKTSRAVLDRIEVVHDNAAKELNLIRATLLRRLLQAAPVPV